MAAGKADIPIPRNNVPFGSEATASDVCAQESFLPVTKWRQPSHCEKFPDRIEQRTYAAGVSVNSCKPFCSIAALADARINSEVF